MTGHLMIVINRLQDGSCLPTVFVSLGAAAIQTTNVRRWVNRTTRFSRQRNLMASRFKRGNRRNNRLAIRLQGPIKNIIHRSNLHQRHQKHHQDALAQQPHHIQIMGNKQIAHIQLFPKIRQQM